MSVKDILDQVQNDYEKLFIKCYECKHLMFSDCYGECSKGIKGIVSYNDGCIFGEKRLPKVSEPSETHSNPSEKEYGCTVCKYNEKCEPTPFGICSKYERKQEQ